jgi:hypothetical protein
MEKIFPLFSMQKEDVPEYYHVTLEGMTVHFFIDQKYFEGMIEGGYTTLRAEYLEDQAPYVPIGYHNWGLDNQFLYEGVEDGWVHFTIDLPRFSLRSTYHARFEFSLNQMLKAAQWPLWLSDRVTPQLLGIEAVSIEEGAHKAYVSAVLSQRGAELCGKYSQEVVGHVRAALNKAMPLVYGDFYKDFMHDSCYVEISGERYSQAIQPGDCACLGSDGSEYREGEGYALEPHNIDTKYQRTMHLVGLCALHEKLRELNEADQ